MISFVGRGMYLYVHTVHTIHVGWEEARDTRRFTGVLGRLRRRNEEDTLMKLLS